MATSAPVPTAAPAPAPTATPTPTPSQPPVEILYAVPVGTVIFWYPPPTAFKTNPDANGPLILVYPPGFVLCDGREITDPESPFNGSRLPSMIDRFVLGAGTVPYGNAGGYDLNGWPNAAFATGPTAASGTDDVQNYIIQDQSPNTTYRYDLKSQDDKNDGNHHHNVAAGAFTVPLPPYMALMPLMRIK